MEPAPEEGFVTTSESIAEVLGFADVEQSFGAMSKGVQTNFSRNGVEVAAEGMASIEGGKGEIIENLAGFLLDGVGHRNCQMQAVIPSYK